MGIDFKLRDFAYPISILRLKKRFDQNQWLMEEALSYYQVTRLKKIMTHAYQNIPYYRKLFQDHQVFPDEIKTLDDLKAIPFLTKDLLRRSFTSLLATDAKKYKPTLLSTSGTTGGQVRFYVDKPSNVLEFVYYWRFWGWAGYRLGETFAEFSAQDFTPIAGNIKTICHFDSFLRKLKVNSLLLSKKRLEDYIGIFKTYKPQFLKGLPSNLYVFSLLLNERKNHGISFRAIFAQGENLLQHQRENIERTFSCKVYDSYGHMERTVAISQCPLGTYHIHSDYGIAELVDPEIPLMVSPHTETCIKEVIGTSLYNLGMPLLRYRTDDFVVVARHPQKCPCQRGFPTVISVLGRSTDVVITPDGRAITALYLVFDRTPGVLQGQIIQERTDQILVKVVCHGHENTDVERRLVANLRDFVGTSMDIKVEHTGMDEIQPEKGKKFKVVVSHVAPETILESR